MNQDNFSTQNLHNGNKESTNLLWQYVQSLNPETLAQLSKPQSQEVLKVMESNISGLLGSLSEERFGITINTSRENLGQLLVSAMMSGYFLRNAEQRMDFEQSWQTKDTSLTNNSELS